MRLHTLTAGLVLGTLASTGLASITVDMSDYTSLTIPVSATPFSIPVLLDFTPDSATASITGYQAIVKPVVAGPDGKVTITGYSQASTTPLYATAPVVSRGDVSLGQTLDFISDFGSGTGSDLKRLFMIDLSAAAGASGTYTVQWYIGSGENGSFLTDDTGFIAGVTYSDGLLSFPVPEPASLGIIGLAGLLISRRRA